MRTVKGHTQRQQGQASAEACALSAQCFWQGVRTYCLGSNRTLGHRTMYEQAAAVSWQVVRIVSIFWRFSTMCKCWQPSEHCGSILNA